MSGRDRVFNWKGQLVHREQNNTAGGSDARHRGDWTLSILIGIALLLVMMLGANKPAMAGIPEFRVKVGEKLQIPLGAQITTGKLTSCKWKTESKNVELGKTNASFCDVVGVSPGRAKITCEYRYYIAETYINSSWDCYVEVVKSGGGSSSGSSAGKVTLKCDTTDLTLDLADPTKKGTLVFSVPGASESDLYLSMDIRKGTPTKVSYKPYTYSENGWPVFLNKRCTLTAKKVGKESIKFELVHQKADANGYGRYYNTSYGSVTVNVTVMCSHKFGEGSNKYICSVCGEKKTEDQEQDQEEQEEEEEQEDEEQKPLSTINAKVENYFGTYDGKEHTIKVSVTNPSSGAVVTYGTTWGRCNSKTAPTYTHAGTYTLCYEIAANGYKTKTGSATVSIRRADSSVEAKPAAKTLSYNGSAQELVTAGKAAGGEMQYSLDGRTYKELIPTGTEAGEYNVYYKVVGDADHSDSKADSLKVTINKTDQASESESESENESVNDSQAKPVTISASESNVKLNVGKSKDVAITVGGTMPDGCELALKKDGSGYEASLVGTMRGGSQKLNIKGTAKGSGSIVVSLKNSNTGEVLADTTISVEVNPKSKSATIKVSTSKVTVKRGDKKTIRVTAGGTLPKLYNFMSSKSDSEFTVSWAGSWIGRTVHPFTIKGVEEGSGVVTISLMDLDTGEVLDTAEVNVEVV